MMMSSTSESPSPTSSFPANDGSDDWSTINRSILSMIAGHLNAVDHVRFRAVCFSWRSTCEKRPKIPLIIISHLDRYRRLSSLSFYDLVLKQTIPLPANANAAVSHLIARNNIYTGSSHGWISFATINIQQRPKISLLNPFTSELLNLPELNEIHVSPIKGIRVALSIPVLVSYSLYPAELSFMRIGHDIGWKTIRLLSPLRNVIAFKDRFYCHFYGRNRDRLYLIDMEAEDGNGAVVPVHLDYSPQVHMFSAGEGLMSWEFLAEFSGDLLVACIRPSYKGKLMYEFLKVDFENRRLNSFLPDQMGEYQLFLGESRPVFLHPERYLDYRPDRLHFTESPDVLSVNECHQLGRVLSLQGHWEDSGQRKVAVGWITPELNKFLI